MLKNPQLFLLKMKNQNLKKRKPKNRRYLKTLSKFSLKNWRLSRKNSLKNNLKRLNHHPNRSPRKRHKKNSLFQAKRSTDLRHLIKMILLRTFSKFWRSLKSNLSIVRTFKLETGKNLLFTTNTTFINLLSMMSCKPFL